MGKRVKVTARNTDIVSWRINVIPLKNSHTAPSPRAGLAGLIPFEISSKTPPAVARLVKIAKLLPNPCPQNKKSKTKPTKKKKKTRRTFSLQMILEAASAGGAPAAFLPPCHFLCFFLSRENEKKKKKKKRKGDT